MPGRKQTGNTKNVCKNYSLYIEFVPGEGFFSMAKKLYVGNLSYNTTEDGLRTLF